MKTSLELSDHLYARVRKLARSRNTSVRALVEQGLQLLLSQSEQRAKTKPRILTFGGDGVTPDMSSDLSWDALRNEIYKGHGA